MGHSHSPVAVLRVHAHAAVEAGVSGICGAGLVRLLSARAGADSRCLHCHRHQAHRPAVHRRGRVPHVQHIGAAGGAGTLRVRTLVHADLENADLQERLELEGDETQE